MIFLYIGAVKHQNVRQNTIKNFILSYCLYLYNDYKRTVLLLEREQEIFEQLLKMQKETKEIRTGVDELIEKVKVGYEEITNILDKFDKNSNRSGKS